MLKDQLNILIQLASSDNLVTESELKLIRMIAKVNGVSPEELDHMLKKPTPIDNLQNLTEDEKFECLYNVVQLMKVDGQIFKAEIAFCEEIANKLGYKKGVVRELSAKIFSDPSITSDRSALKAKATKYLK